MDRATVLDRCDVTGGSGVLALPYDAAWCKVLRRLSLAGGDRIIRTSAEDPDLGGLMHVLWWDPSVRAVLVGDDADLDHVSRAIELTGSDALLLVDASSRRRLRTIQRDTRSADLLVAALGCGESQAPASLVTWSPRVAPALALLDGLHPLSYDAVARLRPDPP